MADLSTYAVATSVINPLYWRTLLGCRLVTGFVYLRRYDAGPCPTVFTCVPETKTVYMLSSRIGRPYLRASWKPMTDETKPRVSKFSLYFILKIRYKQIELTF